MRTVLYLTLTLAILGLPACDNDAPPAAPKDPAVPGATAPPPLDVQPDIAFAVVTQSGKTGGARLVYTGRVNGTVRPGASADADATISSKLSLNLPPPGTAAAAETVEAEDVSKTVTAQYAVDNFGFVQQIGSPLQFKGITPHQELILDATVKNSINALRWKLLPKGGKPVEAVTILQNHPRGSAGNSQNMPYEIMQTILKDKQVNPSIPMPGMSAAMGSKSAMSVPQVVDIPTPQPTSLTAYPEFTMYEPDTLLYDEKSTDGVAYFARPLSGDPVKLDLSPGAIYEGRSGGGKILFRENMKSVLISLSDGSKQEICPTTLCTDVAILHHPITGDTRITYIEDLPNERRLVLAPMDLKDPVIVATLAKPTAAKQESVSDMRLLPSGALAYRLMTVETKKVAGYQHEDIVTTQTLSYYDEKDTKNVISHTVPGQSQRQTPQIIEVYDRIAAVDAANERVLVKARTVEIGLSPKKTLSSQLLWIKGEEKAPFLADDSILQGAKLGYVAYFPQRQSIIMGLDADKAKVVVVDINTGAVTNTYTDTVLLPETAGLGESIFTITDLKNGSLQLGLLTDDQHLNIGTVESSTPFYSIKAVRAAAGDRESPVKPDETKVKELTLSVGSPTYDAATQSVTVPLTVSSPGPLVSITVTCDKATASQPSAVGKTSFSGDITISAITGDAVCTITATPQDGPTKTSTVNIKKVGGAADGPQPSIPQPSVDDGGGAAGAGAGAAADAADDAGGAAAAEAAADPAAAAESEASGSVAEVAPAFFTDFNPSTGLWINKQPDFADKPWGRVYTKKTFLKSFLFRPKVGVVDSNVQPSVQCMTVPGVVYTYYYLWFDGNPPQVDGAAFHPEATWRKLALQITGVAPIPENGGKITCLIKVNDKTLTITPQWNLK